MSRTESRGSVTFRLIALFAGLVLITIPYLWIVLTALKRPVDAAAVPPKLTSPTTLDGFRQLSQNGFVESLKNSAIITVLSTVATLAVGVPAGYAFARGKFTGRRVLAGWLLFSRMIPAVIFIVPLFLFFYRLNLIDTFRGMTLAYMTGLLPFTILVSASYFLEVPIELEEAARIDGCSRAQAFRRVSLPLVLPGITSITLLIGIAAWSEYFIPLILGGDRTTPATVGLVSFIGIDSTNQGALAAGALTLVVPTLLATLLAQRGLMRGLTAGAMKG
jgi:multiple sugar transport system permease protein